MAFPQTKTSWMELKCKSSLQSQQISSCRKCGGAALVANRGSASGWETFRLWRINDTSFSLRVFNKQFVGLNNQGQERNIVAVSAMAGEDETFQIVRKENEPSRIRLRASNGLFLQARTESSVTADYGETADWGDQNPSVFQLTIVGTLRGEYQLTNGYVPDRAPQVMKDHWNTYIVEDDFRFMSENGLTAVRIPFGWWIRNHKIKVISDLHAVTRSPNGNDHSGTRDGYAQWGDSDINETVEVIDFLAER